MLSISSSCSQRPSNTSGLKNWVLAGKAKTPILRPSVLLFCATSKIRRALEASQVSALMIPGTFSASRIKVSSKKRLFKLN